MTFLELACSIASRSQLFHGRLSCRLNRNALSERVSSLFACHADELEAYLARRLNDRLLASDLVQDVFLRVAEKPDIGSQENVRAYLYRIATNLAIDHERRVVRRAGLVQSDSIAKEIADERPRPQKVLEDRDRLARVMEAIAQLPPLSQEIFRLNREEGLSYSEVARRLSISDSSVQKHLARALSHALAAAEGNSQAPVTEFVRSNVLSLRAALKARRR
jgi:RNA polymerase sigma factor (sigma-70 family)